MLAEIGSSDEQFDLRPRNVDDEPDVFEDGFSLDDGDDEDEDFDDDLDDDDDDLDDDDLDDDDLDDDLVDLDDEYDELDDDDENRPTRPGKYEE
jgi:hypothetical protein